MKIVNPLYDTAFKYLMENNRLAKKVLSVILDTEVVELSLGQQETFVPNEKHGLTLFRLDFKAIILEPDGSRKKVLIELQKSKYETDIKRFRNYLGRNYMSVEEPQASYHAQTDKSECYPIITIYILGYNLKDVPYLAVSVNREVIDMVSKKRLDVDSFFINHLTHRSSIIQVRRLPEKRRSLLEKFLVLFNQAWCTEKKYILDLQEVPREFTDMAKYLQRPLLSDDFRRQLEGEEEIDTIFDGQEAKYLRKIEKAINEKEEAEKQKEEALKREEEERRQKVLIAYKLAKQMKKFGSGIDEIIKETGLTAEEIEKLAE